MRISGPLLSMLLLGCIHLPTEARTAEAVAEERTVSAPGSRRVYLFKHRPSRPQDCLVEFLAALPKRPHEVVGVLPLTTDHMTPMHERERVVGEVACESGSDAVVMTHTRTSRIGGGRRLEYYELTYLAYRRERPSDSGPDLRAAADPEE